MEEQLKHETENTIFHPSEIELNHTTEALIAKIDEVKPRRIALDSLSELRLLADSALRYRRQMLALKQYFAGRKITVMMLDDHDGPDGDQHVQSIAHGVIAIDQVATDYGARRRRIEVVKLRGVDFVAGYHDAVLAHGGMQVFPRLIAAEHRKEFDPAPLKTGNKALDDLLGGGLDRGTSCLLLGPAGTGKSSMAMQFAAAAAKRGERVFYYLFEENREVMLRRGDALGMPLRRFVEEGTLVVDQIDPAALAPGQFVHRVQRAVEETQARVIVIDSVNGYLQAMPGTKFLTIPTARVAGVPFPPGSDHVHDRRAAWHRGADAVTARHDLPRGRRPAPAVFRAGGRDSQSGFGGKEPRWPARNRDPRIQLRQERHRGRRVAARVSRRAYGRADLHRDGEENDPAKVSAESSDPQLRVLIVAPRGADAINITHVLQKAGIETGVCPNLSAVAVEIPHGCGAVLLSEEALGYERYRDLARAFQAEPKWSTIPVVLIVKGGREASFREDAARALGVRSNLSIVERPVRAATLVSTLRSALSSRQQQYEVRDLLREREELLASLERKVEQRTADLRELNAELEAFSYSVSHDLRAPLRSMEAYARALCDDHADRLSDEGRHFAQRIMKNAEKMDRLMQDVLTISRLSRSELRLVPLDLDELVQEVIDQYPDLSAAHRHIEVQAPLGKALGDHSSLVQCFSNLLQNAIKFVPKDREPEIRIFSEEMGEVRRVNVRDNGIGIDPKQHSRIFGMFERAGPLDVPGTGVGLAIVKKAVARMGGTVGVESELGAGACFWIQLPCVKS